MAKHNIYPTGTPEGHDRRVEIQWFRDQDVRIGVTRLVPGADPNRIYVPPVPTTINVPRVTSTTTSSASPEPPEDGWQGQFIDLDRAQINHLIRQLRIARDQAYGKDE